MGYNGSLGYGKELQLDPLGPKPILNKCTISLNFLKIIHRGSPNFKLRHQYAFRLISVGLFVRHAELKRTVSTKRKSSLKSMKFRCSSVRVSCYIIASDLSKGRSQTTSQSLRQLRNSLVSACNKKNCSSPDMRSKTSISSLSDGYRQCSITLSNYNYSME